ncbi:MAG: alpha/beta hydrolase [Phenylobacterium sp.]
MTIRLTSLSAGLLAAACLLAATSAGAQARRWDIPAPKAPPGAIALKAPAAPADAPPETWSMSSTDNVPVVQNVSAPTLTPFLPPPGKATGAAVIIAPGGAFYLLAMEHEGWAVARWLQAHGVAAFVLKYRVHPTEPKAAGLDKGLAALSALPPAQRLAALDAGARIATEDAQEAMRVIRARAGEWRVDPARVGFMGFSAGAITTMGLAYADDPATRPAFIAPIYGGLGAPARPVPENPPPMWAAMAADDPLFGKTDFALIPAWEAKGGAVELHLYEKGGHGFGYPGRPGTTTLGWPEAFLAWMRARGLLAVRR